MKSWINFWKNSNILDIYMNISKVVNKVLNDFGVESELLRKNSQDYKESRINTVCVHFPAKYELVLNGAKILGSAQKKGKKALLQQTQLFLDIKGKSCFTDSLAKEMQKLF